MEIEVLNLDTFKLFTGCKNLNARVHILDYFEFNFCYRKVEFNCGLTSSGS